MLIRLLGFSSVNEKWVLFILRLELLRGCVGFYGGLLGLCLGVGRKENQRENGWGFTLHVMNIGVYGK